MYNIVQYIILIKIIFMSNRGKISTSRIAEKLKLAQSEINTSNKEVDISNHPILFVNGNLNRKNCNYIAKNFSLLEPIEKEIKKYCKGLNLTILNYLIFRGIESIKKEEKFLSIEYSDIENQYKKDSNAD
ncbi:hypothetical protein RiCNE_12780 [Rickettsia endosymbiont of Culicoides newsteadi]|nr:hypothetical protein RiCNE_12780 [Rickettsia endosymbiont of Culicoides newsteadi]